MEWLFKTLSEYSNKTVLLFLVILIGIFAYIISTIFSHRKDIKNIIEKWFEGRSKRNELVKIIYNSQKRIDELVESRTQDKEEALTVQKQLTDAIENISKKLDQIQENSINDKIENMRWKILEFANLLINGKTCYKEQYDNILKTYDKYEAILEENDMTNGQVEESMKFIKEKYHELMNSQIK